MAIIRQSTEILKDAIARLGQSTLASFFSRDFEVYLLALELVDFEDNTIDYFMFPVMPSNISKVENERTNIQKTFAGTTVINSTSFVPKDITISGKFGRNLKGVSKKGNQKSKYSIDEGFYDSEDLLSNIATIKKPNFLPYLKTGYGLIKNLQSMISKAKGFDSKGKPFKLIMYNAALGENYLCALTGSPLDLKQDDSGSNMIWSYNLNLKVIANLENMDVRSRNLFNNAGIENVNKAITDTFSLTSKYVSKLRGSQIL